MVTFDRNIGRYLFSTPSRLEGEFSSEGITIGHSFPSLGSPVPLQFQLSESPYSRNHLMLTTSLVVEETKGTVPKYQPEMIIDLMSLWFGKQFDLHGWIEYWGVSFMPYGTALVPIRMHHLGAFNHKPRKDLMIELKLDLLQIPFMLMQIEEADLKVGAFWKAASFYSRALRSYQNEPEVAFLHLISGLEIIASQMNFSEDQIYDQQLESDFKLIIDSIAEGSDVVKRLKGRLYQLRRKVVLAAETLVNDSFFSGSESPDSYKQIFALTKNNLTAAVQAAYDVRSLYVHSGARFSIWLDPLGDNNEIQVGRPVLPKSEGELATLLSKIPTFLGLERLLRFITLRYAHLYLRPLQDSLN
jgi:hypothetical protein